MKPCSTTHCAFPTVMTASRLEPLMDFSQCFAYLRIEVRERTECKVTGWLISAIVEPLQDTFQMYFVRLVAEKKLPAYLNVDTTLELRHAYRKMREELKRIERENSELRETVKKLEEDRKVFQTGFGSRHSSRRSMNDPDAETDMEDLQKRLDYLRRF